jgi:Kdo2-lipid IVA lauroyltransferase/acyltransferase
MLPIGMGGMRQFRRLFQDGQPVALLPDQVPERRAGVYAPFFGVPALTMTLAHRLIAGSDARVVLGSAVRCPGGFRIRFNAMPADIADPDPVVSATAMNRAIEALVMTAPAQYQWEYRRFKWPASAAIARPGAIRRSLARRIPTPGPDCSGKRRRRKTR